MITTNKLNHFANSKNSFIEIKCQHKLLTTTVNKRNLKNIMIKTYFSQSRISIPMIRRSGMMFTGLHR